jgi:hypothetical protein
MPASVLGLGSLRAANCVCNRIAVLSFAQFSYDWPKHGNQSFKALDIAHL